jgi:tetratricopeptide (TPR) repeat protein
VQGERDLALVSYGEALELARAADNAGAVGSALAGLGDLARDRGNPDHARTLYLEALASYHQTGDVHAIGNALLNLGQVARERGATDEAADRYQDALGRFDALDDVTCASEAIAGLAELRRREAGARRDDAPLREAEQLHARALRQRAGIGQRGAMVESFEALAQLAAAQDDQRRAAKLLGFADALRDATSTTVPPALLDAHGRALAEATARLDPIETRAAWQEGRTMALDQAVAYALTGTSPTPVG